MNSILKTDPRCPKLFPKLLSNFKILIGTPALCDIESD
jgi:hypothetical protein